MKRIISDEESGDENDKKYVKSDEEEETPSKHTKKSRQDDDHHSSKRSKKPKFVKVTKDDDGCYILSFDFDKKVIETIKKLDKDDREYDDKEKIWKVYEKKCLKELLQAFDSKNIKHKYV